jgi:hypothetical protein
MAWQKGQSGNPKGRQVEQAWSGAIRRALAQLELKDKDGNVVVKKGNALRAIADTVVSQAVYGNKDAWKEVGDRLEGKAVQPVAAEVDMNLTVEIVKFADQAS